MHTRNTAQMSFTDGTVKVLTTEEAEKLAAERSPVPLELKRTEDERESDPDMEKTKE